jgi:hypothetical protein
LALAPGAASAFAPLGIGVVGVTGFEGDDAGPVPTALVAVTVKVYVSPANRPLMSMDGQSCAAVSAVKTTGDIHQSRLRHDVLRSVGPAYGGAHQPGPLHEGRASQVPAGIGLAAGTLLP